MLGQIHRKQVQKEEIIMTNYAAMGYALLAADQMNMSKDKKEQLWRLMYSNFDVVDEKKAELRFQKEE